MILPSSYLPPISWFVCLMAGEPVFVEQHENYAKQSLRNRCTIDSPNGPLHLTVPVDRSYFVEGKCPMRDVRISTHNPWQRQHWYAIETSYYNSPFFEYLQDDFRPIYEREWTFLIDLNEALVDVCCRLIDIAPELSRTESFCGVDNDSMERARIATADDAAYYQVFGYKHGFLPNLSIADLIFNMGPESLLVLQRLHDSAFASL